MPLATRCSLCPRTRCISCIQLSSRRDDAMLAARATGRRASQTVCSDRPRYICIRRHKFEDKYAGQAVNARERERGQPGYTGRAGPPQHRMEPRPVARRCVQIDTYTRNRTLAGLLSARCAALPLTGAMPVYSTRASFAQPRSQNQLVPLCCALLARLD